MGKVNLKVIESWMGEKLTSMGYPDDILLGTVMNVLQSNSVKVRGVGVAFSRMLTDSCDHCSWTRSNWS